MWTEAVEKEFFTKSLASMAKEKLFYRSDDNKYFAYWPKSYTGKKSTLQSRNALIGKFTEEFCVDRLSRFAESKGLYAVQGAVCKEIGLPPGSEADVVLSKSDSNKQIAEDIVAIFEVKMSIVWNWELIMLNDTPQLKQIGNYQSHQGTPGLLRSDSMLKAIGKAINIRVSGLQSAHIPIVVLGNTPIKKSYYDKVDHLKNHGVIQGFWSLNSSLDIDRENIKKTDDRGFIRLDTETEFNRTLENLISEHSEFFSAMKSRRVLGEIITEASKEPEFEKKAEKFLSLIRR